MVFLNEPLHRWALFLIFAVTVMTVWNGVLREMV